MKNFLQFIQISILILLVSGCVSTSLTSDVDPAVDLSSMQSFYVVKQPADNKGIEILIADELNAMGKSAISGVESVPSSPVDAVISYQDKWMWDITMYMIELNIDLRHPETKYKLATGKSYRTSLARKSPEEMVKEVIGKIFGDQTQGDN